MENIRPQWPGLLIIVLLTFLAYSPALNGDFIWDDDLHITKKKAVIGEESFKRIWTTSDAVYYPLVLTTFWVEWRLWSGQPMGFHLFYLVLLSIKAIPLFFFFFPRGCGCLFSSFFVFSFLGLGVFRFWVILFRGWWGG